MKSNYKVVLFGLLLSLSFIQISFSMGKGDHSNSVNLRIASIVDEKLKITNQEEILYYKLPPLSNNYQHYDIHLINNKIIIITANFVYTLKNNDQFAIIYQSSNSLKYVSSNLENSFCILDGNKIEIFELDNFCITKQIDLSTLFIHLHEDSQTKDFNIKFCNFMYDSYTQNIFLYNGLKHNIFNYNLITNSLVYIFSGVNPVIETNNGSCSLLVIQNNQLTKFDYPYKEKTKILTIKDLYEVKPLSKNLYFIKKSKQNFKNASYADYWLYDNKKTIHINEVNIQDIEISK